jgi:hypothetical protein
MVHQVLYPQRFIASLYPFEASLLHSQLHQRVHFKASSVRDTALAACVGQSPMYEVELIRRAKDRTQVFETVPGGHLMGDLVPWFPVEPY